VKGVPVASVARGAEIEERFWMRKQRVREISPPCYGDVGKAWCTVAAVDTLHDAWVLVRYPRSGQK
jgi:hypothetical protein